jgi:hypothetical protein
LITPYTIPDTPPSIPSTSSHPRLKNNSYYLEDLDEEDEQLDRDLITAKEQTRLEAGVPEKEKKRLEAGVSHTRRITSRRQDPLTTKHKTAHQPKTSHRYHSRIQDDDDDAEDKATAAPIKSRRQDPITTEHQKALILKTTHRYHSRIQDEEEDAEDKTAAAPIETQRPYSSTLPLTDTRRGTLPTFDTRLPRPQPTASSAMTPLSALPSLVSLATTSDLAPERERPRDYLKDHPP